MSITAEQFYKTVEGTPDAAGFDIPEKKEEPTTPETPLAENTPATPNTESVAEKPAAVTTPEASDFNLDAELEKISGGAIKTKDEIARLLETSRKAAELETQNATFRQENEQLKAKAETNPFANDFTKKLNDLYASNANESQIQAFMAINKVDIDKLTPLETSSLALQVKHGLTPDEADRYLAKKYDIDLTDPDKPLDKDAEIALKIDSGVDKEFLKTHKAQVSETPVDKSAQQEQLRQQEYTQKIAKLEPIAKETVGKVLTDSFKGVSVNGKEGTEAITVDLPLSDESKANLAKVSADMVASNWEGLSADDKGASAIRTFNENVLVLQNWRNWLIDVASKTELRIRAEYTNASPIDRGNAAEPAGKTKQQEKTEGVMSTLQKAGVL